MTLEPMIAGAAVLCSGVIAQMPSENLTPASEWGRFGVLGFMTLIALTSIIAASKQSREHRENIEKVVSDFLTASAEKDNKLSEATRELASSVAAINTLLAERPCIRDPKND